MSKELQGSCLCGAVAFRVVPPFDYFGHCHCSRCRKKTGTARATALKVDAAQLKWTKGQERVRRWDMPEARSFATSVCAICGANLPHLTRSGREAIIPAGSLDSDIPMSPTTNEHWESRANWVESN
ncbi:MAG: GFA family protein [Gammaproteobacteria bacterium]|nr:GFA family protein [Gammaproteobacteria bacterium]